MSPGEGDSPRTRYTEALVDGLEVWIQKKKMWLVEILIGW